MKFYQALGHTFHHPLSISGCSGQGARLFVNADSYASFTNRLFLQQIITYDKSNEITAVSKDQILRRTAHISGSVLGL